MHFEFHVAFSKVNSSLIYSKVPVNFDLKIFRFDEGSRLTTSNKYLKYRYTRAKT